MASMAFNRSARSLALTLRPLITKPCLEFEGRCTAIYYNVRHNSQHRVVLLPEIPKDTPETNPAMFRYTSSSFPEIQAVTEKHCFYGLGKSLLEFEVAVIKLEEGCKNGVMDFEELFGPLDASKCQFETTWCLVNLLQLVTEKLDQDRFNKLHKRAMRSLATRIDSDIIFEHLKKMQEAHLSEPFLKPDQEHFIHRLLVEYKLQGYGYDADKYEEVHGLWRKKLNAAEKEYLYRTARNTERYQHTISNPEIVREFPTDVVKTMAHDPSQPSKGPWTVSLHPYIYKKFMEYCPDRQLRYGAHYADVTRGSKSSDPDTSTQSHVRDIRQFRLDMAVTLGYKNHIEMSMATKMAGSVETVQALINNLSGRAKQAQEVELENLQKYAESRGFSEEIEVFDVEYFKRKQRRTVLGMSDEDLRDYFPLPKVMNGIFNLCSSLFDIEFEEVSDQNCWHPDVKLFAVKDIKSGEIKGHFYFDPFIREDKGYAGGDQGWYLPIRQRSKFGPSLPLGAMILTFQPPNVGKPCLLNFYESKELLRKFGQLIQHTACDSDYSDSSGIMGCELDVLEFVGKFFELWIHNPEVLKSMSGHWSNKAPLSEEVVNHLSTTIKHHMAGYELCQKLYLADYDMGFHSSEADHFIELEENVRKNYLLLPKIKGDCAPLHLRELIASKGSSGIYSDIWSDMLAADAFSAIEEAHNSGESIFANPDVKAVTQRFRDTFLSIGSSRPSAETFRKFRGRDPSHEALLVSRGLKKVNFPNVRSNDTTTQE